MCSNTALVQIFIFLLLSLTTYSQSNIADSIKINKVFRDIDRDVFSTSDNKKGIPKRVIKSLSIIDGKKFRVANPNEDFNSTDVILNERLPNKRLVYFAFNKNFYIIFYEQGGFGKSNYVRIVELQGKSIKCVLTFLVSEHRNFDEFKFFLNNSSFLKLDGKKSSCF